MDPTLRDSYSVCRVLARRAGNFYYAFLTLPKKQFWAMCALYGFTRLVDDAGDDPHASLENRTLALQKWRTDITAAIDGDVTGSPVLPALMDTVRTFQIPHEYLFALIQGVEMDLRPVRYQTYSDLANYCYHVAGVVGLCCIHVWGFSDPKAKPLAITLGEAFQLTNILRDLKEDIFLTGDMVSTPNGKIPLNRSQSNGIEINAHSSRRLQATTRDTEFGMHADDHGSALQTDVELNPAGRCYLPLEEMSRFGYSEDDLRAGKRNSQFHALMQFEVQRARELYATADELKRYLNPIGISVLHTMVLLYRGILNEIERRDYDVFSDRVRLSTWKKLYFAFSGILLRFWPTRSHNGHNRTGTGHLA